ncbi:MAG TPA: SDR family NAD(P)-dependent oxidoreductase, partial [Vicinamibacteria bacterium]|nr:SDR family NAD(P)-dependent oxidoreductase [Vicinamibacteria bacterium]
VDACAERLQGPLGLDLRRVLYPDEAGSAEAGERLRQTAITQPALFVVEYALARLWMKWGVKPQCMIGHSVGEYVAAHLAGVLSLEDALALVAERGRLMQSMPPGSMLAVALEAAELSGLVAEPLALAAINAPRLCVVSGPTPAVDALEERLKGREVFTTRLHTSHAFHSSMMDGMLEEFTERVRSIRLQPPRIPFVSNLTGSFITPEEATSPRYWADHLRGTVRFAEGVATLWSQADRILLEVGPGNALANLAKQQADPGKDRAAVSSMRHPHDTQSDLAALLSGLGRLWTAGAAVSGRALYGGEKRQRVELPRYPFERERFWIEPPAPGARVARRGEAIRREASEWFYLPNWRSAPPARMREGEGVTADASGWLLFADQDEGGLGARLASALRAEGARVVTVESGDAFGGSASAGFRMNPSARADFDRLFEELKNAGPVPQRIVHGFSLEGRAPLAAEARFERGYYSLFFLGQALAARRSTESVSLKVLSTHMHSVVAGDEIQPDHKTLLGLARVIPQELHTVRCACVDVDAPGSATWVGEGAAPALSSLIEELRADEPGVVAALRGGRRFVLGFEPLKLEPPTKMPARLREGGVYLVTGGLGGVTFALGAYLAHSVKARLVLTGRSVLPPREQWPAFVAAHGESDPMSVRMARVERLEKLGAEVLVLKADSGDLAQMEAAVAQAEARFGRLDGVIHGAGIVGGNTFRPLVALGREECEQQFHPKVLGLEILERVLAGRRLDFCLLTSSLSSVLGGFGYAAYAAANLFMDAFTERHNLRDSVPWISVNWDEWRFGPAPDEAPGGAGLAQLAMAPAEGASALARILGLRGVGQVVVSTGDLEARMERWVRLTGLHQPAKGEASPEAVRRHPRPNLSNAYVAPSTSTEEKVAVIWQSLLGIEKVGIHDNFFELGGHSLLAIQLVTEIRNELDVEISVATLFEGPTVESLSRLVVKDPAPAVGPDPSSERGARRKEENLRRQALREQTTR